MPAGLAKLADGCETKDIQILKQYTAGACPDTRANNYAVASLGISNTCADPISEANQATCTNAFLKGAHASTIFIVTQNMDKNNKHLKFAISCFTTSTSDSSRRSVSLRFVAEVYTGHGLEHCLCSLVHSGLMPRA